VNIDEKKINENNDYVIQNNNINTSPTSSYSSTQCEGTLLYSI
jgi:hypothetical protein